MNLGFLQFLGLAAAVLISCAGVLRSAEPEQAGKPAWKEVDELAGVFERAGVKGTFVVRDGRETHIIALNIDMKSIEQAPKRLEVVKACLEAFKIPLVRQDSLSP